ncbi:MAG TPA: hypothetical protein VD947_03985 [Patescibacteria group bacterium]|nr:hypothetical protein [Patescibacteria group bacterium]
MAKTFSKRVASLDKGFVLSPERYHPDKFLPSNGGVKLSELVYEVRESVFRSYKGVPGNPNAIVFDTSDAYNGFLNNERSLEPIAKLGSQKKKIARGDVIISRLRPYLRQVAFVGNEYYDHEMLLGSTEFFVLRPLLENDDVSYLVPFLLSSEVQKVLSISVEGAHHPRFNSNTLLELEIPRSYYEKRNEISKNVTMAIQQYNTARKNMQHLWSKIT